MLKKRKKKLGISIDTIVSEIQKKRKICSLYNLLINKKKIIVLATQVFFATTLVFAEGGGLSNVLGYALGFFQSGYMKAILTIALGGSFLGMIGSRGEQGVWKKFLPLLIVSAGLLSLSAIINLIFGDTSGTNVEAQDWTIDL